MRVLLIRHAQAGDRTPDHHDIYRPLSPKGRKRAATIADLLTPLAPDRILSSPASRCVQTVEPLAEALGLTVETNPDLWEGSMVSHVLSLLTQNSAETTAVCSHGDIIPGVIEAVAADGARIKGRGCEKGSIWLAEHDGERWTMAHYISRSEPEFPAALI